TSLFVIGGPGNETVNVYLSGINADLNVDGGSGRNKLVVYGSTTNQNFQLNGTTLTVDATTNVSTSGIQETDIHGMAPVTTLAVTSTVAGTQTFLYGGSGTNHFWIGSDGKSGKGTLDSIRGTVKISAGSSGKNELNVDDRAAVDAKGNAL